jgi:ABC-type polysaccharide/polyol phosphate transport system ATPase subunit
MEFYGDAVWRYLHVKKIHACMKRGFGHHQVIVSQQESRIKTHCTKTHTMHNGHTYDTHVQAQVVDMLDCR